MEANRHRIRLRGPWNVGKETPAGKATADDITSVHFPQTWNAVFGSDTGTFRLSRRFGCPTGIGRNEVVQLEVESSTTGRACLNERDLGTINPGVQSFDVSGRLHDGNQLDLWLNRSAETDSVSTIVEVAVVIETVPQLLTPPPTGTKRSP